MISLGVVLGIGVWLLMAISSAAKKNRDAKTAAAEAKTRAEAEEESKKSQPMKYKPLGNKMKKPVFLPTEADSLLEEDPVIAWEPTQVVDADGVVDWDKTEAGAVFLNPKTGELFEYGHK